MDGYEYEKWCARLLQKRGYKVRVTPAGHDQGIDIVAERHHKETGFQCKYYDTPVGNKAVQEAYSGAAYYGCDKAAVITNSVFTKSAWQLADELQVNLYEKKDPQKHSSFSRIRMIFSCMLLFISAAVFLYGAFHHTLNDRMIWTSLSVFTAGAAFFSLLSLYSIALLLNIIPVVFLLILPLKPLVLMEIPLLILMILLTISLFYELKKKNIRQNERKKQELRNAMNADMQKTGMNIQTLLEEILAKKITLKKTSYKNRTLILEMQTSGSIPACRLKKALEMLAEELDMVCTYEVLSPRQFRLKLQNRR